MTLLASGHMIDIGEGIQCRVTSARVRDDALELVVDIPEDVRDRLVAESIRRYWQRLADEQGMSVERLHQVIERGARRD